MITTIVPGSNAQKEVLYMSEIKNAYETVIVFSVKNGDDAVAALIQKVKELIEKNAVLDAVDEWGRKRLAYPINKETEGHYVLFDFTSGSSFPSELDRIYKITDGILRSLIVKKEKNEEGSDFNAQ